MKLVMQRQEDGTPWLVGDQHVKEIEGGLLGRESFSQFGVVRGKPCASIDSI